jgi:hypothetical protein
MSGGRVDYRLEQIVSPEYQAVVSELKAFNRAANPLWYEDLTAPDAAALGLVAFDSAARSAAGCSARRSFTG